MAEFTTRAEHTNVASVCDVVAPYGFGRATVNGSDVEDVWLTFGRLLEQARRGGGPFLLECLTHRRRGHYEGDQQSYRDALADGEWADRDPIARLEALARDRGWLDDERAQALTAAAQDEVERSVEFARRGEPLTPEQAADFVYAR